jgi:hypothetical protein
MMSGPHSRMLLVAAWSLISGSPLWAATSGVLDSTEAWLRAVQVGQVPASLAPLPQEQGCFTPDHCQTRVGTLSMDQRDGALRWDGGPRFRARTSQPSRDLPVPDWTPLDAFAVSSHGKPWGVCMTLAHEGLGRSGSFQRWTSVVLVPLAAKGRPVAHRWVGYWATCEALVQGDSASQVRLPVLEAPSGPGQTWPLRWQVCEGRSCITQVDLRRVVPQPGADDGALLILPVRP